MVVSINCFILFYFFFIYIFYFIHAGTDPVHLNEETPKSIKLFNIGYVK